MNNGESEKNKIRANLNQAMQKSGFGYNFLRFWLFIILVVAASILKGQDPAFSQFYANPLYLNPSLTGTNALPRLITNYRNQWPNQGNTFVTYNVSYDAFLPEMHSGIGFKVMYDSELNGVINTINTSMLYAYHIQASDRTYISMALEGGFIYKKFNTSQLIFPGMIDQGTGALSGMYSLPFEDGQKIVPDFSLGVTVLRDDVFFGAALHHFTTPDLSILEGDQLGKLPVKFTLHAGAKGHRFHRDLFSREFTISPNLVYQQQGGFKQINAGLYLKEDMFTLGLWYRNNLSVRPDAVIAMIGIQKDRFQFGYSFDYSLSELSAFSYGSHEISLTFFFGEIRRRFWRDEMVIPQM